MKLRGRPFAIYGGLAFVLFLVCTLGAHTFARVSNRHEPMAEAAVAAILSTVREPTLTLVLFIPFPVLAFACGALLPLKGLGHTAVLFAAATLLLGYIYFDAYAQVEHYVATSMSTASTLSLAFLPFKAVGALVLLCAAAVAIPGFQRAEDA